MQTDAADQETLSPRAGLSLGLMLSVLAGLPFLAARFPQLTDYPSHLARYHVMLDGGRSPWLSRYYDFEWIFAGNLGADLLMWPLGHLLGAERAGWLIGFLIPVLTGLGIVAVLRALKRPLGFGPLLAFSAIWSPAMGMGFYNFCLSLALALLSFALWVRLEDRKWRWALFMPLGLIVWLCHVSGWGALGILVFGWEWQRRKSWQAFAAPWPLLLPIIPQLLAGGAPGSLNYGAHAASYKLGIWMQALRAQDMRLDLATLGIMAGAVLLAALARRIDGRLGWAALIFAALSLVMPRHFGGGDFADYRLIALALMTGCMAIDWRPSRAFLAAALALFLVRLGVTTLAWHDGSQRTAQVLSLLDRLPQGAHVAGAMLVARDRWGLDPLEHVPSYATVRRDALVNTHFAIPGVHMLQLREGGPGFIDPSHRVFHRRGERIDLSRFPPAARADYLWYVGTRRPDALPPGAAVIAQAPGSLLARLAKPAPAR